MLFDPAQTLASFMQLTDMSAKFKFLILALGLGAFACAWVAERRVLLWLARVLGRIHVTLWPRRRKQRKRYKEILEKMRI